MKIKLQHIPKHPPLSSQHSSIPKHPPLSSQHSQHGESAKRVTHLADVELGVREELDEGRDDVGLDDGLDLLLVARGDVRDSPACLLADALLRRAQQVQQPRQRVEVDDHLQETIQKPSISIHTRLD